MFTSLLFNITAAGGVGDFTAPAMPVRLKTDVAVGSAPRKKLKASRHDVAVGRAPRKKLKCPLKDKKGFSTEI
jgi:hypothetical protein